MASRKFTKQELIALLNTVKGKTLGEVDVNNVFDRAKENPKITGIAGEVIEQSVLGYPKDNKQEADIIVDGKETEVKTTGLKEITKDGRKVLVAKEPVSITAVSPDAIINETFYESHFWNKLERLLFVFYHYASKVTVPAYAYSKFVIQGYSFFEFSDEAIDKLKNDWTIVRDFIRSIQGLESPEDEYPRISSELRSQLMLIDTAPKWPNKPRFRLKKSTLDTIVKECLGEELEELSSQYASFSQLDKKLSELTKMYYGKTVTELVSLLGVDAQIEDRNNGDYTKAIVEPIICKMFGAKEKKMAKIKLFSEIGLVVKSIVQTQKGLRTEDTKLVPVDFNEWLDKAIPFEDTELYSYFNNPFLFAVFKEPSVKAKLADNTFMGFKRIQFSNAFIEKEVFSTYRIVQGLIEGQRLEDVIELDKNGNPIMNQNGMVKSAPNFPKAKDCIVFLRGTSSSSSEKPLQINGVRMYQQNVWIKGTYLNQILNETQFL